MERFRFFSTTADIGIACSGGDPLELLGNAVTGLTALLVGDLSSAGGKAILRKCRWRGDSLENLLVKLLGEVLHLAYEKRLLVCECRLCLGAEKELAAELTCRPLTVEPRLDIKAVTYHRLKIRHRLGRSHVRVVLDV